MISAILRTSLGQTLYLSALAHCDAIVGNSSSGIYEAPSLKTATVNIGERQKLRLKADSVFDCAPRRDEIVQAITRAMAFDCSGIRNPYGEGNSAPRIVEVLKGVADPTALLKKRFHEIRVADVTDLFREAIRVLAPGGVFMICDVFRSLKGYGVKDISELLRKVRDLGAEEVEYRNLKEAGLNIGTLTSFWKIGYVYGRKSENT